MTAKRYTTFPILAVVSVYVILVKMALERWSILLSAVLLVAVSGLILLSASISYPKGIKKGRQERAHNEEQALFLSMYEAQPNKALRESMRRPPRMRRHPEIVREQASILQRLGYNVFSEGSQVPRAEPDL